MTKNTEKMIRPLQVMLKKLKKSLMGASGARVLVAAGLLGIVFLAVPSLWGISNTTPAAGESEPDVAYDQPEDYAAYLAEQLEKTLGQISGVGEIKVMVTLSQDSQYVFAADTTESGQSQEGQKTQQQLEQKYVILERSGAEEALVTTRISPKVQGVIIVCRGGNDPVVVAKLTEAVTAALGIGPSRIAVSDLQSSD